VRKDFISELIKKADKDHRVVLISEDVGWGVLNPFWEKHPDKYIAAGIREQLAVNMAVGLALSGKKVFIYGIINFMLYRAFEQIRAYVDYLKLDIKLVGVGKDMTYKSLGHTHWATEDKKIMKCLDNFKIFEPKEKDFKETFEKMYKAKGPCYMRLK